MLISMVSASQRYCLMVASLYVAINFITLYYFKQDFRIKPCSVQFSVSSF